MPHQITHRPEGKTGIILWQIENEYDYAQQPEAVKRGQISALVHDSRDLGIDVPLFTCQSRGVNYKSDPFIDANVIDTVNSYPKYDMNGHRRGIEGLRRYQPDKFMQITEQQGGWFGQVGGKLAADQGFDDHQINMITQVSMASGITSMNYYMFFGGTNLGDWAGHDITTSYDYDAPIREWGGVDKRYAAVQAIGLMLQEHGAKLARAVLDKSQVLESSDKDVHFVVRRAIDGSKYIFVTTEQRSGPRKGSAKIQFENGDETVVEYSLDPYGAKILYMPTDSPPVWLPKPAPDVDRPTDLPGPIAISEASARTIPGRRHGKRFNPARCWRTWASTTAGLSSTAQVHQGRQAGPRGRFEHLTKDGSLRCAGRRHRRKTCRSAAGIAPARRCGATRRRRDHDDALRKLRQFERRAGHGKEEGHRVVGDDARQCAAP